MENELKEIILIVGCIKAENQNSSRIQKQCNRIESLVKDLINKTNRIENLAKNLINKRSK